MALQLTKEHIGLKVVHPTWSPGYPLYGTILSVPNQWHADINTSHGRKRVAQGSLVWQQDFKR